MSQTHNKKIPSWLIEKISKEIEVENLVENTEYIPQRFEDSTHDLWRLESKQGTYFLKVCSNTDSPFWQIMQQLFGVDLLQGIQYFEKLYVHISTLTSLQIPELIKAESIPKQGSFILTKEVIGSVPEASDISQKMVEQLALHLSNLHADKYNTWGTVHEPLFKRNDWPQRIKDTLRKSAQKWGGDQTSHIKYLKQALDTCDSLDNLQFVPLMPDLRWDQFLVSNNEEMILLDLDAFVLAPRELDLVLLEYLLNKQQMEWFVTRYSEQQDIPNLDIVRPIYRLLLFYMQVLGEQDINNWMERPARLKSIKG